MKVTGAINGILGKVDKYSELIGAGATAYAKRGHLSWEITKISQGHIHFPDVSQLVDNIFNEPIFQQGVAAVIGGMVLESLNIHPVLNKAGKIARKVGTGMAATLVVENTLGYATNPGYPLKGGNAAANPTKFEGAIVS